MREPSISFSDFVSNHSKVIEMLSSFKFTHCLCVDFELWQNLTPVTGRVYLFCLIFSYESFCSGFLHLLNKEIFRKHAPAHFN